MRSTNRWPIAVALCGIFLGSWQTAPPATAKPSLLALALAPPATLGAGYNLPVVPVPPPPVVLPGSRQRDATQCPVEVRALIVGESLGDARAMVAGDGSNAEADEETQLVKMGQTLRLGGGPWLVRSIDAEQLVLARGDVAVRCALAKLTR